MGKPGKDQEQVNFIASKVDHLFNTIRRPDGKRYTYQQVAEGSGLNFSYLRKLRCGQVQNPSRVVLEKLNAFFGVTPDYWFRTDNTLPATAPQDHQVGVLLRKLTESNLTEEQLRFINEM